MADKVEMLKDITLKRGNDASEINIAMDGRYNSVTIASRKKPGQNASKAIGLACETMTDRKFIIQACFKINSVGLELGSKERGLKCSALGDTRSAQPICLHFSHSRNMTWDTK